MSQFDQYPHAFEAYARVSGKNDAPPDIDKSRGIVSIVRAGEGLWDVTLERPIPKVDQITTVTCTETLQPGTVWLMAADNVSETVIRVSAAIIAADADPAMTDQVDWSLRVERLIDA